MVTVSLLYASRSVYIYIQNNNLAQFMHAVYFTHQSAVVQPRIHFFPFQKSLLLYQVQKLHFVIEIVVYTVNLAHSLLAGGCGNREGEPVILRQQMPHNG